MTDYEIAQILPTITVDEVKRGFMLGDVCIASPSMACGDTVCVIGGPSGNWFFFGGEDAENENPLEYVTNHDFNEILQDIVDALNDFRECEDGATEWLFYRYTLDHC